VNPFQQNPVEIQSYQKTNRVCEVLKNKTGSRLTQTLPRREGFKKHFKKSPLPGEIKRGFGLLNWLNRIIIFSILFDYFYTERSSPLKNLYS
jgi:hypothetical protein